MNEAKKVNTKGQCVDCVHSKRTLQMGAKVLLCLFDPPVIHVRVEQTPMGVVQNFISLNSPVADDHRCHNFELDDMRRN